MFCELGTIACDRHCCCIFSFTFAAQTDGLSNDSKSTFSEICQMLSLRRWSRIGGHGKMRHRVSRKATSAFSACPGDGLKPGALNPDSNGVCETWREDLWAEAGVGLYLGVAGSRTGVDDVFGLMFPWPDVERPEWKVSDPGTGA